MRIVFRRKICGNIGKPTRITKGRNVKFSEINCYQPNISATRRLRVIDSTQIAISPFRQYLSKVCFLYAQNYLLDLTYNPLSLEYQLQTTEGQVRAIIDTPLNILEFQANFKKNIQNRSVILEITDEFGDVEIINNYQAVNFTKTATSDRSAAKTYEISFLPYKLKSQSNKIVYKSIIKEVLANWVNKIPTYLSICSTSATLRFFHSDTPPPTIFQPLPSIPIRHQILFALSRTVHTIFLPSTPIAQNTTNPSKESSLTET
jgi:hypothetical protein